MKALKKSALLFLLLFSVQSSEAENWLTSFEDAKMLALTTNKFVLVDFWATWCGPCKRMDKESWNNSEVQLLMDFYVPVKIDIDSHRQLALNYGVKSIPHIFIMDANGKVIHKESSYKSKTQVMAFLKEFALSSEFMAMDLINYHKNQNMANSFRLGVKYQDFSLRLDRFLKRDFLTTSQDYFNEAKKNLKKEGDTTNVILSQKIELYEINEFLILNRAEKALKQLEKVNIIQSENESLYNFLNYVALSLLQDDKAEDWAVKLSDNEKNKAKLYLSKN